MNLVERTSGRTLTALLLVTGLTGCGQVSDREAARTERPQPPSAAQSLRARHRQSRPRRRCCGQPPFQTANRVPAQAERTTCSAVAHSRDNRAAIGLRRDLRCLGGPDRHHQHDSPAAHLDFRRLGCITSRPDSPASAPSIDLQLFKAYEAKTDRRRPLYSPELTVSFPDERGYTWIAHSPWGGPLSWDGPTIALSAERRTVSFSAATAVRTDATASVDLDRISWVALAGAITCPEPLPDLP